MKRQMAFLAATTMLLVSAVSASAAEPFYFHKANVARETFVAEFAECEALASGVKAPDYYHYTPNMYARAAGAFFAALIEGREKRGKITNVMRTCMTDKGYRRVEVPDEQKKELKRLGKEESIDRLFALTAAPEPVGKVLPQ